MNDLSGIPTAFRRLTLKSGLTQNSSIISPASVCVCVCVCVCGGGRGFFGGEGDVLSDFFQIVTLRSIS